MPIEQGSLAHWQTRPFFWTALWVSNYICFRRSEEGARERGSEINNIHYIYWFSHATIKFVTFIFTWFLTLPSCWIHFLLEKKKGKQSSPFQLQGPGRLVKTEPLGGSKFCGIYLNESAVSVVFFPFTMPGRLYAQELSECNHIVLTSLSYSPTPENASLKKEISVMCGSIANYRSMIDPSIGRAPRWKFAQPSSF